jgi:hypothetical protein
MPRDLREVLNARSNTDRAKCDRWLVLDSGCSTSILNNKDTIKNYQSVEIHSYWKTIEEILWKGLDFLRWNTPGLRLKGFQIA